MRTPPKAILFTYLAISAFFMVSLYSATFVSLWQDWNLDPNYGHAMFVPLLVVFLLWWKRNEIKQVEQKPYGPGLLVVLLGVTQYMVGILGNELFTIRSSMVVITLGVLLALWGKQATKVLLFPVLYLLLMFPIPYIIYNQIAFPMKLFATEWAVFIIDLLRVSAYNEGNIIHLQNTSLEVVNACSGLRSLMALFTFTLVFAYVAQSSFLFRGILVAAIFPIAIAANIVRIVATALLAHYKGPETAQGFLHESSGIILFTVALVLTFGVNEILRRINRQKARSIT